MYDYLIVGAGLCGCTLANLLKESGKTVLLVDKDTHIGGACYSEEINGIEVHKCGPHIYRTNDLDNWNYLNKFSPLHPFVNEPIAKYHDHLYNLPFNMNTFHQIWPDVITPSDAMKRLSEERSKAGIPDSEANLEAKAISLVGETIYKTLIKEYTEKQWGVSCSKLPASIISVLPIRFTYSNNYFSEKYQGIPTLGYTKMMENMIQGVDLKLGYNVKTLNDPIFNQAKYVIYTGRLDFLFSCQYGVLPYRGAIFKEILKENLENYQGVAVMNFTSKDVGFIRRTEHRHFMEDCSSENTILSEEYSIDSTHDIDHSYYPIMNPENIHTQELYKAILPKNFFSCGVNGDYQPYTMDGTLNACKNLLKYFSETNKI